MKKKWVTILVSLSLIGLALTLTQCTQSTDGQGATREEQLVNEIVRSDKHSQLSLDDCAQVDEWCHVIEYARRVTRPEWETLFPQTAFFVVKRTKYYRSSLFVWQKNLLIVEQDGRRYSVETFQQLLEANGITTVTDENRELVARALALMWLPNYLEDEIVFTGWEQGEWSLGGPPSFNYSLTMWTRINGTSFGWLFWFRDGLLERAEGGINYGSTGDYVEVKEVVWSPSKDVTYRRK